MVEKRARVNPGPDENTLRGRVLGETKTRKDGQRHDNCNRDCGNCGITFERWR